MTQVLIYSIQSEHVLNFLKGYKTIEVRKRDLPKWAKDKLSRGEKVIGYGYCTKGGEPLYDGEKIYLGHGDYSETVYVLNGTVVFKFEVSGSNEIKFWDSLDDYDEYLQTYKLSNYELCDKACLSNEQLENYLTEALGYAHHFTNIQPIEPMELGEFSSDIPKNKCDEAYLNFYLFSNRLRKAPQSFMTAWVKEVVE